MESVRKICSNYFTKYSNRFWILLVWPARLQIFVLALIWHKSKLSLVMWSLNPCPHLLPTDVHTLRRQTIKQFSQILPPVLLWLSFKPCSCDSCVRETPNRNSYHGPSLGRVMLIDDLHHYRLVSVEPTHTLPQDVAHPPPYGSSAQFHSPGKPKGFRFISRQVNHAGVHVRGEVAVWNFLN